MSQSMSQSVQHGTPFVIEGVGRALSNSLFHLALHDRSGVLAHTHCCFPGSIGASLLCCQPLLLQFSCGFYFDRVRYVR